MSLRSPHGHPRWRPALTRLAAIVLWLALWQLAATIVDQPILLVGPWETLGALGRLSREPSFWLVVGRSLASISLGFLGAFLTGCVVGVAAGRLGWLHGLIGPAMAALKATPVACIVVVLLLWVGSAGVPMVAVALVVVPAYYGAVVEAMGQVPGETGRVLALMGVGPVRRFLLTVLPALHPYVVATSRSACAMAWKAGVAAELIGLAVGTLGERVYQAKLLLATDDLLAWTVVVVLLSVIFERLFRALVALGGARIPRLAVVSRARKGRGTAVGEPVRVHHLSCTLGGREVLRDLDLEVDPGRTLLVRGHSGVGKTTLVRCILGLQGHGGEVGRGPGAGCVLQGPTLVESLTAEENVQVVSGLGKDECARWLSRVLPADALGRPVERLSGGQRRRVEVVRALLSPGSCLVMDEPFSGLDEVSHRACAALVAELQGSRPLLVASHDREDVGLLRARVLDLDEHGGQDVDEHSDENTS